MYTLTLVADLDDVVQAFRGTGQEGHSVAAVPVRDSGEAGFSISLAGADALTAWQVAVPVCDQLGLWPLIVGPVAPADIYRGFPAGADHWPEAILARAASLPSPLLDPAADGWIFPADTWPAAVEDALYCTRRRVGHAPPAAAVLDACPAGDFFAMERFLLDWEEARSPTTAHEPDVWLDPDLEGANLALLPTEHPWAVPAYVRWRPWWGDDALPRDAEGFVRTLQGWHARHGAAPWISDGSGMYLHVGRPVTDMSEAFSVAIEMMAFIKPEAGPRRQARALFRTHTWWLHDRP